MLMGFCVYRVGMGMISEVTNQTKLSNVTYVFVTKYQNELAPSPARMLTC